MSLCQTEKGFSCGACCGLFNLTLDKKGYDELLKDRTEQFNESVNFDTTWTIPEFRRSRESIESKFSKKDETIYNCPYLGYIENKKIGCLIHPARTGNPKSQNYSFYGTSICQGYSCKNIERKSTNIWKRIFEKMELDSIKYSRLASDHISIDRIESFFLIYGIELIELESTYFKLIEKILFQLLNNKSIDNLTSFEIDMETDKNGKSFQLLVYILNINLRDELYLELEGIKNREVEKRPVTF